MDDAYLVPRHLATLIGRLESVERGECRRLLVSMPPRHGKSLTATVRFPAWWLGRHPQGRVIVAAHTASLAQDFSRRCRNEFARHCEMVFGVRVADDSSAVDHWDIAGKRGGVVAAGVGGPITGKGADLLVIDDPVKDAKDSESATQRKAKVDWYQQVARSRLHPGGAIVLVMTRWHESDLAGWLLEEAKLGGEQWETLTLPMLDETGQALWPERYSREEIDGLRRAVGSRAWESLYQQRPSPQEGGIFKRGWWKRYDAPPKVFDEVVQSWDCAFKDTAGSDYVVGGVIGRAGANRFVLDVVRRRMSFSETCRAIRELSERWPQAQAKYIEDKANGPAVIDALRDSVSGLIAVDPEGGKVVRARAIEPQVEAGNWWLPRSAHWVDGFVEEFAAFPNGAHDDQVDMLTQAGIRFGSGRQERARLVVQRSSNAVITM